MVGDSKEDALASVEEIFKALSKTKQPEHLGNLNEALIYISSHSTKDKK